MVHVSFLKYIPNGFITEVARGAMQLLLLVPLALTMLRTVCYRFRHSCARVLKIYPYGRPEAIRALLPFRAEYAAKYICIRWLVRLRWSAERQYRIEYLDGWFAVVDRAAAKVTGYFRHPAF